MRETHEQHSSSPSTVPSLHPQDAETPRLLPAADASPLSDTNLTNDGKPNLSTSTEVATLPEIVIESASSSSLSDSSDDVNPQQLWLEPSIVSVLSSDAHSQLFKVVVNLDGHEQSLVALIDTGSNRSLMNYRALPDRTHVDSIVGLKIYGVAESKGIAAKGLFNVELIIAHKHMLMTPFVVLPESVCLPVDVILGMDFLRANGINVNVSDKSLTFNSESGSISLFFDDEGRVRYRRIINVSCTVTSSVHLPPRSTTEVLVTLPDIVSSSANDVPCLNDVLLFDHEGCGKLGSRVVCLPGLVSAVTDRATVLVTNNTDHKMHMKSGSAIGTVNSTLSPVDADVTSDFESDSIVSELNLDHLSDTEADRVRKLLLNSRGVFGSDESDFSASLLPEHRIELLSDAPIYQRPRRLPAPVAEEIEQQCRGLHDLGIIEPSASPWSSPIVPIRKKDGSLRLCVDYRALNRVTRPDKFPMPNLTDSIFGLHGVRYFTKLDLLRGYYQIPLHKDSKECTAFSTPHGHWQFNRLSFGMRNGPSAFQRGLSEVLSIFPWKKVVVYIDDILIMETTFERHYKLVSQVLATLEKHRLIIKPDKCEWFQSRVEFLGHVVGERGVSKTKAYVDRIDSYPRPENVRQLREFLGLVNFQRKFIAGCSELQKPLSCLTGGSKSKKLDWTSEMICAFESLKNKVKEDIELAFPNYDSSAEKLELWVDASNSGAGAVLTQVQDGDLRIIAFASMSFEAAQLNYSILEKELAGLRWGIKTFRAFLYGTEFVLRTDHQPLVYLHNMRLVDSRLARTLEDLSDFNFVIKYTPGRLNTAADALSRIPPILTHLDEQICHSPPESPVGFVIKGLPVPGGGNSLFESLAVVLRDVVDVATAPCHLTHQELRTLLVNELLANPSNYNLKLNRTLRRDFKLMRNPNQLPSLEILLAASRVFDVDIYVYFWSTDPVVYTSKINGDRRVRPMVHLQCISGIHFNPLIAIHTYDHSNVSPSSIISCDSPDDESSGGVGPSAAEDVHVDCDTVDHVDATDLNVLKCDVVGCGHNISGRPVIPICCNQRNICVLLDTGAEVSLIKKTVLPLIKYTDVSSVSESVSIVGISGKTEHVSRIVEVNLLFPKSDSDVKHRFLVVSESAIPTCALVGADFMCKHNLSLDLYNSLCHVKSIDTVVPFMPECLPENPITYVGMAGVVSDSASTIFVGSPTVNVSLKVELKDDVASLSTMFNVDVLKRMQRRTPQLRNLKRSLHKNLDVKCWPKSVASFKKHRTNLSLSDDVIVYNTGTCDVPVISFVLLVEIILVIHSQLAHIGRDKVTELVSDQFFHPSIRRVANDVCTTCVKCQLHKVHPLNVVPPTVKIKTSRPFELVAIDLISFGRSRNGYVGCLMAVDHNSKWLSAVPIKDKTAKTVVAAFERQVLPFLPLVPERILSDNGPEFASLSFNEFLRRYGITHTFTTPYNPSSNGAVERVNRTIKSFLASSANAIDWDESLPLAVVTYNNTLHKELGKSPAKYLLCHEHDITVKPSVPCDFTDTWKVGSPQFSPFSVGQMVIRKVPMQGNRNVDKFSPRFDGPHIIKLCHENGVAYELENCEDKSRLRAHYTQLREWKAPPHYLIVHPYYRKLNNDGPVDPEIAVQQSSNDQEFYAYRIAFDNSTCESSSEDTLSITEASDPEIIVTNNVLPEMLPNIVYSCLYDDVDGGSLPVLDVSGVSPTVNSAVSDLFPSYAILDAHDETWDVSLISREDIADISESLVPSVNVAGLENAMESVLEAADAALSSVESFLEQCSDIVQVSLIDIDNDVESAANRTISPIRANLEELRERTLENLKSLQKRRRSLIPVPCKKTVEVDKICTRSKGPVADLPNVQPKILERKGNH